MKKTLIAVSVLALAVSACSIDVEANPDGSLTVESVMTESDMQQSLGLLEKDPNLEHLAIEFHDGYAAVEGQGIDDETGEMAEVSFEVRLFVDDGHLGATISNGLWNGYEIPEWIVDAWNKAIARDLEKEGRKDPDSSLVAVELTDDALTMEWRVDPK